MDLSIISTIYALLPFVVIYLARWVLKERITLFEILLSILCFVGIACAAFSITQTMDGNLRSYLIGILLVLLTVAGNSSYYVYIRYHTRNGDESQPPATVVQKQDCLDYRVPVFFTSISFIVWYLILRLITQKPLAIFMVSYTSLLELLFGGTLFYFCILCEVVCLKFETASITTMLKNTEIVWGYFFNILVNHLVPNLLGLFGFSLAVLTNVGISLYAFYKWKFDNFLFKQL